MIIFDLRRVSTVISSADRVHITLTGTGSSWTLCGIDLLKRNPDNWRDNIDDRQPSCDRCIEEAIRQPVAYPFHKLTKPLASK